MSDLTWGRRCGACKFALPRGGEGTAQAKAGECRRHAPVAVVYPDVGTLGTMKIQLVGMWPPVDLQQGFCWEWESALPAMFEQIERAPTSPAIPDGKPVP